MLWLSNSKLGQDAKLGSIFELKDNKLGIKIHKYIGCGDELYLSCKVLRIDMMDLGTEDFNKAVKTAKDIVYKEVNKILEEARKFYFDENENEFIR